MTLKIFNNENKVVIQLPVEFTSLNCHGIISGFIYLSSQFPKCYDRLIPPPFSGDNGIGRHYMVAEISSKNTDNIQRGELFDEKHTFYRFELLP